MARMPRIFATVMMISVFVMSTSFFCSADAKIAYSYAGAFYSKDSSETHGYASRLSSDKRIQSHLE